MNLLSGFAAALAIVFAPYASKAAVTIVTPAQPSRQETLAAREVMRYVYLRTGQRLPMSQGKMPPGDTIVIGRQDHLLAMDPTLDPKARVVAAALQPEQYLLRSTAGSEGAKVLVLTGGDDTGTLYAAYRFAETLGVRFYLSGDVIPDQPIPLALPPLNETGKPLFSVRGILPFNDFPEGPDWWGRDDYLATVSQLARMRMNFIGLHTYPEGGPNAEPGVWIGQPGDGKPNGQVTFSGPSSWYSTQRDSWGYRPMKTSAYSCGAGQLFPSEWYAPDIMTGLTPQPKSPEQSSELFNRTGALFHDVFQEARGLGVRTCIGTETPLTIPKAVQERIRKAGKDPNSHAGREQIYEGVFKRLAAIDPVDYYWLWTPESWTWQGNTPEELARTTDDIHAAIEALKAVGHPFQLAACGWVLGPQENRAALDKILPKDAPISSLNRSVGNDRIDPAYASINDRPKWAIPWLENDPQLTALQPWVGRLRYDAADALKLGCTGLIGIHWRTAPIALNVAALADAAWDQSYVPPGTSTAPAGPPPVTDESPGGEVSAFTAPVAGTNESIIYQTVRYDTDGYHLAVPNGDYTVTLMFNEPFYSEAGKRVFGVKIQGKTVIARLDMVATAGKNHAIDLPFPGVMVTDGMLRIDFIRQIEYPAIAGIVVANGTFTRKINCGGPTTLGYTTDPTGPAGPAPDPAVQRGSDRTMPVQDLYLDFATANFGPEIGPRAAAILSKLDGLNMPKTADWIGGPGGIRIDRAAWAEVAPRYAFVDQLAALRSEIKGAGDRDRFDIWLNRAWGEEAIHRAACIRGQLDAAFDAIHADRDEQSQQKLAAGALKVRVELARAWEAVMDDMEAAVCTPGDLGTLTNLEQHTRLGGHFLDQHDAELVSLLDNPLPANAQPSPDYTGPARIIVPTVRTRVEPGESLTLKVMLLTPGGKPASGTLFYRPMGERAYLSLPLTPVARSVYRAILPAMPGPAYEYYIRASIGGTPLVWPATAPALNHTVVVSSLR